VRPFCRPISWQSYGYDAFHGQALNGCPCRPTDCALFPPGTSKWNKIEHRLFSFIIQNWRGKPLVSHEVIVNLIAATGTNEGLRVECGVDTNEYPKGIKVSAEEMAQLNIKRDSFHGDWIYTVYPN
jgi:hypothetical protein